MEGLDLSGLRDIHFPAYGAGWWPPALGWWGLASLPFVLAAGVWLWRHVKRTSVRLYAVHQLKKIFRAYASDIERAAHVSLLMKRIALRRYGRDAVAKLHGQGWAEFIRKHSRSGDGEIIRIIAAAVYARPESFSAGGDAERRMYRAAYDFIRNNT